MPGCNCNVGEVGGVLRLTELSIKKPLQQVICMLHCNELVFRHIFEELDGPCDGPGRWVGEIGQTICAMSKNPQEKLMDFVKFEAVPGLVPKNIGTALELNNDQDLLHKMCIGVQDGYLPPSLKDRVCGHINMARHVAHVQFTSDSCLFTIWIYLW